jgi:hypothetical protein
VKISLWPEAQEPLPRDHGIFGGRERQGCKISAALAHHHRQDALNLSETLYWPDILAKMSEEGQTNNVDCHIPCGNPGLPFPTKTQRFRNSLFDKSVLQERAAEFSQSHRTGT